MKSERPLSPHLQVYKWQLSSLLSITHRLTSIINLAGITLFALWICMLFLGENIFNYYEIFAKTFVGKFIMGYGYDLKVANLSGIIVLVLSFILTFLAWII